MKLQKKIRSSILGASLAAAAVLMFAPYAAAQPETVVDGTDAPLITSAPQLPQAWEAPVPEAVGLVGSAGAGSGGVTSRDASPVSEPSPAGCTGSTDYPHKSGDQASVHARMRCSEAVPRVETATVLYRDRWYGPQELTSDVSWRTNSTTSQDAHPHWDCAGVGTYTYKGFSQHASLEDGVRYTATTSNWQDPGISRFNC
jgi:hypothetical protein